MTLSGWLVGFSVSRLRGDTTFGRLMMRPKIRPVTPDGTGVLTHSFALGVTGVGLETSAGTPVAPALSPCQPLLRPTSPTARRSVVIVIRPPRLGTACHLRPLAFIM